MNGTLLLLLFRYEYYNMYTNNHSQLQIKHEICETHTRNEDYLECSRYSDIAEIFELGGTTDEEAPQLRNCPRLKRPPCLACYSMFTLIHIKAIIMTNQIMENTGGGYFNWMNHYTGCLAIILFWHTKLTRRVRKEQIPVAFSSTALP